MAENEKKPNPETDELEEEILDEVSGGSSPAESGVVPDNNRQAFG